MPWLINARAQTCLILFALLVISGCGGTSTHPVTGVVTLDGAPLQGAHVIFYPIEGGRTNSIDVTDAAGAYDLTYTSTKTGAMIGDYKILILKPKGPEEKETLPAKYNTDSILTAKVTADGDNIFNFDLESK